MDRLQRHFSSQCSAASVVSSAASFTKSSSDFVASHAHQPVSEQASAAVTADGAPVTRRLPSRGVRAILDRLNITVDSAARVAGVPRTRLSSALSGAAEMRADWIERMPIQVVREYVRELAASVGFSVVPMGNANSERARILSVVSELADVQRATVMTDSDGRRDVAECTAELREVREAIASLLDREALLLRAIEARGEVVQ